MRHPPQVTLPRRRTRFTVPLNLVSPCAPPLPPFCWSQFQVSLSRLRGMTRRRPQPLPKPRPCRTTAEARLAARLAPVRRPSSHHRCHPSRPGRLAPTAADRRPVACLARIRVIREDGTAAFRGIRVANMTVAAVRMMVAMAAKGTIAAVAGFCFRGHPIRRPGRIRLTLIRRVQSGTATAIPMTTRRGGRRSPLICRLGLRRPSGSIATRLTAIIPM